MRRVAPSQRRHPLCRRRHWRRAPRSGRTTGRRAGRPGACTRQSGRPSSRCSTGRRPAAPSPFQLWTWMALPDSVVGRRDSIATASCVSATGGTSESSEALGSKDSTGAAASGEAAGRRARTAAVVQPAVAATSARIASTCQKLLYSSAAVGALAGEPARPGPGAPDVIERLVPAQFLLIRSTPPSVSGPPSSPQPARPF